MFVILLWRANCFILMKSLIFEKVEEFPNTNLSTISVNCENSLQTVSRSKYVIQVLSLTVFKKNRNKVKKTCSNSVK